jgi:hypothetical protein
MVKIIPTKQSFRSSGKSLMKGLGGGFVQAITKGLFGDAGFLGTLLGGWVAGSFIKGQEGTVISTVAGVLAMEQLINGSSNTGASANAGTGGGVM